MWTEEYQAEYLRFHLEVAAERDFVAGMQVWNFADFATTAGIMRVDGNVVLTMREDVFNVTIQHDLSFYDQYSSGKVLSRITNDTRDLGQLVTIITDLVSLIRHTLQPDEPLTPFAQVVRNRYAAWRKQQVLSPALIIALAFLLSLIGFDLVMSLDPRWYSTLFGGYFFIGCFYTGIVALYLLSMLVAGTESFKLHVRPRQLHDLGKLAMAFCIFTGYLFYAQFLTIWYGNLPEETQYVILRVKLTPWEPLAWVVLFTVFLGPLFFFLSRRVKVKRIPVIVISFVIMVGMWLERFILVVPSLWKQDSIPFGPTEGLVTAGFFGLMGLTITAFLQRVPLLPISDPLFRELQEKTQERLEP